VQVTLRFYGTRIIPVGFFLTMSLVLGNYAYLHLSVAFIQMVGAPTRFSLRPPLPLTATATTLNQPTVSNTANCCSEHSQSGRTHPRPLFVLQPDPDDPR
jgi:hypothetical protein